MQIFFQTCRGFEKSLLNHIRSVDPCLDAPVEAHVHHAAQAIAVPGEEFIQCIPVARPDAFEQNTAFD